MKKKRWLFLLLLLALPAVLVSASALELRAGGLRPFDDNQLTLISEEAGTLTIHAESGSLAMRDPVTDLRVDPGTTSVSWDALTFGDEPAARGRVTLRAVLTLADGTERTAECVTSVGRPHPAAACCLPAAESFYPDGKNFLRVEVAQTAAGECVLTVAPKASPDRILRRIKMTGSGREPTVFRWDGRDDEKALCPPGDYVLSAYTIARSARIQTAEVTLLAEPEAEAELAVSGPLIPKDLSDDAAVWAALMAPVAVGAGEEGNGLALYDRPSSGASKVAGVSCRTVGLEILEIREDGWVRAGVWCQHDGSYVTGWVPRSRLRMIRPNTRYGAVLDKAAQTLTVYERGKPLGTVLVSTGKVTARRPKADTHSGAYLLGTRMSPFVRENHEYDYPIRIDGSNLIHQVGFAGRAAGRDFEEETALLGTMASHGCIRVDARVTEESGGINAWWIWTHMGHDCKIIITEAQERQE